MSLKTEYKRKMYERELASAIYIDRQVKGGDIYVALHSVCESFVYDENHNIEDSVFNVRFTITNKIPSRRDFKVRVSCLGYRKHKKLKWIATRQLVDGYFEHMYSFPVKLTWEDSVITYSSGYKKNSFILPNAKVGEMRWEYDLHHCHYIRDDVYGLWIEKRLESRKKALSLLPPLKSNVKFSFIIPFFWTNPVFFEELVDSIKAQTYENWELIAINASPDDDVLTIKLADVESRDDRIKVVTLNENLGISLNSAEGAKVATGDYLCYCDHDDTIEPILLEEYARAIEADSSISLLYCDEDKLFSDEDGHLGLPIIKPDYSPVFLSHSNYICHMLTIKKSIYDEIGPSVSKYDGAQDYDMTLRCIEKCDNVFHVPDVLYHWRRSDTSTAGDISQKHYSIIAGDDAISDYLQRAGYSFKPLEYINGLLGFYFRRYDNVKNLSISVIVPVVDDPIAEDIILENFRRSKEFVKEYIVCVEDNLRYKFSGNDSKLKVIECSGYSKSQMINKAASLASGDCLAIMNQCVLVDRGSVFDDLAGQMCLPSVHAVSVRCCAPDGEIHGTASTFGRGCVAFSDSGYMVFHHEIPIDETMTCDDFMVVSRDDFESVGGYDENEFPHTFADADFSLRLRDKIESEGERCVFVYAGDLTATIHKFPQTDGVTAENFDEWKRGLKSSNVKSDRRLFDAMDKFYRRHKKRIEKGDPFYSPRLDTFKMNHRFDIEFLLDK